MGSFYDNNEMDDADLEENERIISELGIYEQHVKFVRKLYINPLPLIRPDKRAWEEAYENVIHILKVYEKRY